MAKSHLHKTSVTQNKSQKQNNNKNHELEQQNRALFVELHGSDEQKSAKVREQIIRTNGGLIRKIAKNFENGGVEFCDLIQEGYIGLVKAVDSFDSTRGVKFSTHAFPLIRKEIFRAYSEQRRVVTSRYCDELLYKIKKAEKTLFKKFGYQPSVEELAKELQMSVKKVKKVLEFEQEIVSLDSPVDDSGNVFFGDFVENTSAKTPLAGTSSSIQEKVHELLLSLDENERNVIELRHGVVDGNACKLKDIAEFLNLPYPKVRQLESKALMKLRALISFESVEGYFSSLA